VRAVSAELDALVARLEQELESGVTGAAPRPH